MKKIYFIISSLLTIQCAQAQIAEDALKLTWQPSYGTARNMAIGGAMVGLGGEISSAHSNPAGLGFYKNGEFVFSPGFSIGKGTNTIDYRGTNGQKAANKGAFNLGTTGVIIAGSTDSRNLKSAALSLSINKIADYNNLITYKGLNTFSSGAERYAEEFSAAKQTINDAINNKFLSLGTRLALYTYLVDTLTLGGVQQVVAFSELNTPAGLNQENRIYTKGSANELALSLGVNKDEKLFFGASVAMPVMNYNRTTEYTESDATTITNNGFSYYNYKENLKTLGLGFNVKLGVIYRPIERVRFGFTINTPTVYSLTDQTTGTMNTKVENLASMPLRTFANTSSYTEQVFTDGAKFIESKYTFITPWKIAAGASYVFRETENVKKQRAFIAADIEYVTQKSVQYSSLTADDQASVKHYKNVNDNIKAIYKNVFNFKIGGEIKFNKIMLRLGGAYYGNPNKDATLKQNRINLSGGLGYRHKGIFIDATYIHQLNKGIDMPYRLGDKANTFATTKNTNGSVMLTVGTKF
jgi:hypothetical protein